MASAHRTKLLCFECCLVLGGVSCGAPTGESLDLSGGTTATGGSSFTGGTVGAGGTNPLGTGTATGGALQSGGTSSVDGTQQTGGNSGSGGVSQAGTGGASVTVGAGGMTQTGGVGATGGISQTGGASGTGGAGQTGGVPGTGGPGQTGGVPGTGGPGQTGGVPGTGGPGQTGGVPGTGGTGQTGGVPGTGGTGQTGGVPGTGGTSETGGEGGTGGSGDDDCSFTVEPSTSSAIPTVGIVEWSTALADVSSAEIVYTLNSPASSVLNVGGTASVDLTKAGYRTLLLGLKGQSTYTFYIEATSSDGSTCVSSDYDLTTGATSGAPQITRTATNPSAQAKGFIITSGGLNGNMPAIIIDADGAVVWWASAPASCSRARMDYEGENMWMMALNAQNGGGEMRRVSMDGSGAQNNVSGLSSTHHDFTVLPGGIVAAASWMSNGMDVESNLLERSPDGTVRTAFRIGSNLYVGGPSEFGVGSNTYHSNSILYYPSDDSYTIGDRNPNLFVKVTRGGQPVWQFGGNCSGAPAPKCATASWDVNHGHHLLDSGNFLLFSNGAFGSSTASRAYEFSLNTSGASMTATEVHSQASSTSGHSDSLGDVQRLPNGNTLIVFSNNGRIEEFDASWNVVQTLTASSFGYVDWRETLYGPPAR